jgi:hypothetical protein
LAVALRPQLKFYVCNNDAGASLARAADPQRRSSNANSLQSQNSAGFPQICAIFQRDNLRRHF